LKHVTQVFIVLPVLLAGIAAADEIKSDQITGPFKMVHCLHDCGEQEYFLNIPSKFISADGRTLWLCYSANYGRNFKFDLKSNPPGSRCAMCLHEFRLLLPADTRKED
jgi:hypothetical protein